ncbi:MAG: hypothetical protein ACXWK9_01955, partial [Myxococcaceae bacterium]
MSQIDGRFAEEDGSWSTVAEGVPSPGPSWLASRPDIFQVDIVFGGTAYCCTCDGGLLGVPGTGARGRH